MKQTLGDDSESGALQLGGMQTAVSAAGFAVSTSGGATRATDRASTPGIKTTATAAQGSFSRNSMAVRSFSRAPVRKSWLLNDD